MVVGWMQGTKDMFCLLLIYSTAQRQILLNMYTVDALVIIFLQL